MINERDSNGNIIDSKLLIDRLLVDKGTTCQLKQLIHHPFVEHSRFMLNFHKGNGYYMGFISKLIQKIVFNYVGGDIGCGIITYKIGKIVTNKNISLIDEIIRKCVPIGTKENYVKIKNA